MESGCQTRVLDSKKIKRTVDHRNMAELDWDDPNYVEAPTKYYHTAYESSTQQQRSDDDDYARGRRSGYRSREPTSESYGNKRRPQYDRYEDSSSGFSESISISTDMVGRIIGRGGSNIARIQNEYNVRIKVDKVELIVKVSGEKQLNVSCASDQLRKQVESESSERRSRFDDNRSSSYGGGGSRDQGGGRSSFNFAPAAPAEIPTDGDLTGTIDWQALNKASVSYFS